MRLPASLLFVLPMLAATMLATTMVACDDGLNPASSDVPVLLEILAEVDDPPGAPGRKLSLVRYTIAPGVELDPHRHPGIQMASIVSGTLTYRIASGTAVVHRSVDGNGVPHATEVAVGPSETHLTDGDVVIEESALVHSGANLTEEPVIILATLLTEASLPLSVPATPDE